MKKLISILVVLVLVLSLSNTVFGSDKICGEVLNTDITAYINGAPIKSFNIDGWTGVIAEYLSDYGFVVEWNPEKRTLSVGGDGFTEKPTSSYQFEKNSEPVGSHAAYVYETDIKTDVCGKEVKAFNIDVFTIIYIDELQLFCDVVWNAEKREISYTYRKPWEIVLNPDSTGNQHEGKAPYEDRIQYIEATFTKASDGKFNMDEDNLEHISWIKLLYNKYYGGLQIGFSMVAHHLLADYEFSELCYHMVTNQDDGSPVKDNADLANKHTKIFINDIPVNIKEVRIGKGNNHSDYYFVLDSDIPLENINKISFRCEL